MVSVSLQEVMPDHKHNETPKDKEGTPEGKKNMADKWITGKSLGSHESMSLVADKGGKSTRLNTKENNVSRRPGKVGMVY